MSQRQQSRTLDMQTNTQTDMHALTAAACLQRRRGSRPAEQRAGSQSRLSGGMQKKHEIMIFPGSLGGVRSGQAGGEVSRL